MKFLAPEGLLNALSQFLDSNGALSREEDAVKFCKCMQQLGKGMVNICIYLHVIHATGEKLLSKLLEIGLWDTMYNWLVEYKDVDATILGTLLKSFLALPVTMDMLRSNKTAKLIKSLSKHSDQEVSKLAQEIVQKWMQLIKSAASDIPSSESKDKKKKKKHEKGERGQTIPDSKGDDSNDIDRSVESPPPAPLFKEKPAAVTVSIKGSVTTAKQHTVKERSAGVEDGVIKPKPRGSKPAQSGSISKPASSAETITNVKRASSEASPETKEKKPRTEAPDGETDLGRVKIIAPRPKPAHIVQDSDGFMAALMTKSPAPRSDAKKKRVAAASNQATQKVPTSPTSPTIAAPPSFYKDTLEGPTGVTMQSGNTGRISPQGSSLSSQSEDSKEMTEEASSNGQRDVERSAAKKTVRWKDDANIKEVFYFELLEDERVNVNRMRDSAGGFEDLKKKEMLADREAVKQLHHSGSKHSGAIPLVTDKFPWRKPESIDGLLPPKMAPGVQSLQRQIQAERESSVLAALYFSREMVPYSASEPDRDEDMNASGSDASPSIPLEAPVVIQSSPHPQEVAEGVVLPESVMDTIQKLASGEAGVGLLHALANTTPLELNQVQELINGQNINFNPDPPMEQSFPEPGFPMQGYHEPMDTGYPYATNGYGNPAQRGNQFNNGFRGGRPPFRGGNFRGGFRGRGAFVRGNGPGPCRFFVSNGHCNYGMSCRYLHNPPHS